PRSRSSPAPPLRTSAPPSPKSRSSPAPPLTVSIPAPARITFAPDDPVSTSSPPPVVRFSKVDESIAGGVAAAGGPGRERHRVARDPGVEQRIDSGPAVETVTSRTAFDRVVAPTAGQGVRTSAAGQDVCARRPDQGVGPASSRHILEVDVRVTFSVAAAARVGSQRHGDRSEPREEKRVDARPTVEIVGARASFDDVVPAPARDGVVADAAADQVRARRALERVVAGARDEVLEIDEAFAGVVRLAGLEIDHVVEAPRTDV